MHLSLHRVSCRLKVGNSHRANSMLSSHQPLTIRPYDHATDHLDISNICRNVYQGTDYLPRLIGDYSNDPWYLVLTCSMTCSQKFCGANNDPCGNGQGTVIGVIGSHLRGGMIFLFGLRVKEEERGRGVAKLLSSEIISQSLLAFPSASSVFTVTIPENKAAISIFGNLLGGSESPRQIVYSWPPSDVRTQYEESIGWPSEDKMIEGFLKSMLDHWPRVVDALQADSGAAKKVEHWTLVHKKDALKRAISSINNQAIFQLELDEWLPGMYEPLVIDSEEVDRAIEEERVWILPSTSILEDEEERSDAALIVYHSKEARGRMIVGITAKSEVEVNSALLFVHSKLQVQAHLFMTFIHLPHISSNSPSLAIFRAFDSKPGAFITYGILADMV